MADRVLVMYGGRVVEAGTVDEIFYNPQHPYTWGLLGSVPRLDLSADAKLSTIPGQPPNLLNMDENRCPFAHRCRWVNDACLEGFPAYSEVSPSQKAACVLEPRCAAHWPRASSRRCGRRGRCGVTEQPEKLVDARGDADRPRRAAVGARIEEALPDPLGGASPPGRSGVCR